MVWFICGTLVGLFLGIFLNAKRAKISLKNTLLQQLQRTERDHENLFLCLRREISNVLIQRDPEKYIETRLRAREQIKLYENRSSQSKLDRINEIALRYPAISDFDIAGTKDYVLLEDAYSSYTSEELEAAYIDIALFPTIRDTESTNSPSTSDLMQSNDLELLQKYIRRLKDHELKQKIIRAMQLYYDLKGSGIEDNFSNSTLSIQRLDHFAASRYGIHLKDTNEFGIAEFFSDEEHPFESFYRSDTRFEAEISLEPLILDTFTDKAHSRVFDF